MACRFPDLSPAPVAAPYLPPVAPNECVNLNRAQLQHGVRELTRPHWLKLTSVALGTDRARSCTLDASGINTLPAQTGPQPANSKGGTPGELTTRVAMVAAEPLYSHTNTTHINKLVRETRLDTQKSPKLSLDYQELILRHQLLKTNRIIIQFFEYQRNRIGIVVVVLSYGSLHQARNDIQYSIFDKYISFIYM